MDEIIGNKMINTTRLLLLMLLICDGNDKILKHLKSNKILIHYIFFLS